MMKFRPMNEFAMPKPLLLVSSVCALCPKNLPPTIPSKRTTRLGLYFLAQFVLIATIHVGFCSIQDELCMRVGYLEAGRAYLIQQQAYGTVMSWDMQGDNTQEKEQNRLPTGNDIRNYRLLLICSRIYK